MNWEIKIESTAAKELKKLDKVARQRIERFIDQLACEANPRFRGIALQGEAYDGLWRYRVGDYRLICQIKDKEVLILILEIGHRKAIYR
ncbi:MAG: type II toxin-antitoxin system RelE/ParE family toxin [Candidatus Methylumidiphilus alinenensis]|uniref:Type II toxin-antitoxin system RelE/ParE family toxin n=1 Tax=Candidatus Methylumidiphilus alinenensis TaxID=2202197 RepID=A0A2W4R8Q5_9GAMM|nr:MAG: type II toxin-antitoxin system RelE/ParE family toxin [Candidatus Methylumidiphilus alinenensis]